MVKQALSRAGEAILGMAGKTIMDEASCSEADEATLDEITRDKVGKARLCSSRSMPGWVRGGREQGQLPGGDII